MFVYVIRYENQIDGEFKSGTFDYCYTDEKSAEKVMLEDFNGTKAAWVANDDGEVKSVISRPNENGCSDYCGIWHEAGSYDYYNWYVDKIEIVD